MVTVVKEGTQSLSNTGINIVMLNQRKFIIVKMLCVHWVTSIVYNTNLGVFSENPCYKQFEHNVVYILIITYSQATSQVFK